MARVTNLRTNKLVVAKLEEAKSLRQRLKGLLGRKSLSEDQGLLIYRSGNSIHTFFMKFSIDLIFIDSKRVVRFVATDVHPWRLVIAPLLVGTDCLELSAGAVVKRDIRVGDQLRVET